MASVTVEDACITLLRSLVQEYGKATGHHMWDSMTSSLPRDMQEKILVEVMRNDFSYDDADDDCSMDDLLTF